MYIYINVYIYIYLYVHVIYTYKYMYIFDSCIELAVARHMCGMLNQNVHRTFWLEHNPVVSLGQVFESPPHPPFVGTTVITKGLRHGCTTASHTA